MAMRPKRYGRYMYLRNAGFLPFEARALSTVPRKPVPYFREIIAERRKEFAKVKSGKMSWTAYEKKIHKMYSDNAFTKATANRIVYDPWKFLRHREDEYIQKHPEYQSPWVKRRRAWVDFTRKADRTFERQYYERQRGK